MDDRRTLLTLYAVNFLNAIGGWWWADPLAAYVLVYYAVMEARHIFTDAA